MRRAGEEGQHKASSKGDAVHIAIIESVELVDVVDGRSRGAMMGILGEALSD